MVGSIQVPCSPNLNDIDGWLMNFRAGFCDSWMTTVLEIAVGRDGTRESLG